MPNLPKHMRKGSDPLSRLAAFERRLEALEEWAEQNGWDVATGFVKSDLHSGDGATSAVSEKNETSDAGAEVTNDDEAKSKRGRRKKGSTNAPAKSETE